MKNEIIVNNTKIYYNRISNTDLLALEDNLIKPEVPQAYIESQNRWVANPFNPDYPIAMNVYFFKQGEIRFDYILNTLELDVNIEQVITRNQLELFKLIEPTVENIEFLYKKYFLFSTQELKELLINRICLTENSVFSFFQKFDISRNEIPIMEHGLHNAINVNLEIKPLLVGNMQLVHPLDEYKIVKDTNIDWIKWLNNEYSLENMATTIALYRMNKIIESHNEDEIAIEQEKRSKKAK